MKIFDVPAYVGGSNYPAGILLFLFYGFSVTPLMYPLTFVFHEPSNAYIFLIVANLFTGITCVESSFLLQVFSFERELAFVYDTLKTLFLVFPPYCLGRGLIDIAYNDYYNTFYAKTGQFDKMRSPFEWTITTRNLCAMACVGALSWLFTLLLEYEFFGRVWRRVCSLASRVRANSPSLSSSSSPISSSSPLSRRRLKQRQREDPDVADERTRIDSRRSRSEWTDRLVLVSLRKCYTKSTSWCDRLISHVKHRLFKNKKKTKASNSGSSSSSSNSNEFVAVKDLTLGVPEGECFGLLGVNGG